MRNDPLVYICIPSYNSESTISNTLDSLINQTYKNICITVLDNKSTDNTVSIALNYNDPRIRVLINKKHVSPEENFNKCINISSGKYTCIFHSDDVYENNIIEEQVAFLENNSSVGAVFTAASLINTDNITIGNIKIPKEIIKNNNRILFLDLFKLILKKSNFIICPSAMVRTKIYKFEIKKWRYNLFKSSSDLDVWLRIAKNHYIGFINKPLINYRISSSQGSALNRLNIKKADFFLVTEFYINKFFKGNLLNYEILITRDELMRAFNLMKIKNLDSNKSLIYSVFKKNWFHMMIFSYKGFLVIMFNFFLIFINLCRLEKLIFKNNK